VQATLGVRRLARGLARGLALAREGGSAGSARDGYRVAWKATARLILAYVRVLVTGMSGVGKSTLVRELRRRGFRAYGADDDGFSEPRADGRWGWWVERVADVLKQGEAAPDLVFFAGCSEEQVTLPFDYRVLLTAPAEILVQRLMARTTNGYGRPAQQRAQVLADLAEVEPLLRRSADLILVTTEPTPLIADAVLSHVLAATA
jgi:adenylate kinase family enzyme